jgi:hypothetical protein
MPPLQTIASWAPFEWSSFHLWVLNWFSLTLSDPRVNAWFSFEQKRCEEAKLLRREVSLRERPVRPLSTDYGTCPRRAEAAARQLPI